MSEEIFKAVDASREVITHLINDNFKPDGATPLDAKIVETMIHTELLELAKAVSPHTLGAANEALDSIIKEMREELHVTNALLDARNALIAKIPGCKEHGPGCLENAKEWITNALQGAGEDIEFPENSITISSINSTSAGIRVTHEPSGLSATFFGGTSQHANRVHAIAALRFMMRRGRLA